MKIFLGLLLSLAQIILGDSVIAQTKLIGDWEGNLNAGGMKLRLILHIKQNSQGLNSFLDSPQQNALNIPLSKTEIKGDSLIIEDQATRIKIKGEYKISADSILALFFQGGATISLTLGRTSTGKLVYKRTQIPQPPFPYSEEEVVFVNKEADNIRLSGTLTIPKDIKKPPVVILVSGSGAQNRDEELFGHKPFLVIADYLSRNGIAVLRYDDRGTARSEGNFKTSNSYDFSTDAESAIEYLQGRLDINTKKIGLLGHSEGGMIIPMIAARNNNTAFIISFAGPGIPCNELLLKQIRDLKVIQGVDEEEIKKDLDFNSSIFKLIKENNDNEKLSRLITQYAKETNFLNGDNEGIKNLTNRCISPWFKYFISFEPARYIEKVKCPVLALNGELDMQVNAKMNLEGFRESLKKGQNSDNTIIYFPGLNHAFQEAKTGDVSEYAVIEQTISPKVLDTIVKWIKQRF